MSVLIVDDHPAFRTFVHELLETDGWHIVGEAGDAAEALAAVAESRPDVVLLDVQLPGRSGFEVADQLAAQRSPPQVVLMSSRSPSDYGDRLRDAPVRGFLAKSELSGAALSALASREGGQPARR